MGNEGVFVIIFKEDNLLVGFIGIIIDFKWENIWICMLGYWLKECYWGKGMVLEVIWIILDYGFNVLGLYLILVNCYLYNICFWFLLEWNGFVYEGIFYEVEMIYDGYVYDYLCFY